MANYNTTTPGDPYVRAARITLDFPPTGQGNPIVTIEQRQAVKLTTGVCVEYNTLNSIQHEIDLPNAGGVTFELVDMDSDTPYGQVAGLPQLVVLLCSYVRMLQRQYNV